MTTAAFLGTGTMGAPMVRNLAAAGFDLRVWNRTRSRAEPLAECGAVVTGSPAEAARGADVLITMLLDADATIAAGSEAAAALNPGGVWVQMGTIGLPGTESVCAAAAEVGGIAVVDAPVLGTKMPAEKGELVVLAAGAPEVRERVQPLFDAVGSRTRWVGESPSQAAGTRMKLVANNWVLTLTNAVGESIALAEDLGVDPSEFLAAIEGTAVDSAYAHVKGKAIINGEFPPAFALSAAAKDAALVSQAASDGLRLDLAEAVRARFARALTAGHGDEDMAAVYYASRP
ncbi:NAD(P)-dependent oxidoreductase [Saccharopolyspora rhizosphaerae]|uniref:NAD(P)-dependent oxidoreductase n=1 Tax=Saccharopolyspora rhizosphaerae TaxID=2492662 RepID=A0A3R8Q9H4_9PSEU|nr:NAD(P)-dependent oxidoreductase [Saccharopolyspora rhizosphaerae]RRO19951.1 NAD(P)-dependent oxidoreductase [Saccharopolyspora rhizosphaerae]